MIPVGAQFIPVNQKYYLIIIHHVKKPLALETAQTQLSKETKLDYLSFLGQFIHTCNMDRH